MAGVCKVPLNGVVKYCFVVLGYVVGCGEGVGIDCIDGGGVLGGVLASGEDLGREIGRGGGRGWG